MAAAPRPAVVGYVEAATAATLLGWAWVPGQAEPVRVEARLGAETVAQAVADGLREDLARNGIGEGRHAFALPVPEALRSRIAELQVVARTADGATTKLGSPPVEDGVAEKLAQLQRGVEMLVSSQRVMHRNLQAALLSKAEAAPGPGNDRGHDQARAAGPLAEVATAQAALQEGIATLELFVARLEQGMANLAARSATPPAQPRWALGATAAVAVAALVLSAWGLFHSLPG